MSTAVVWLRRDLRVADNPALQADVRAHDRVVCAYVHAPQEEAPWAPGAASRWIPQLLERSGYPAPILDLAASREAALDAYRMHRAVAGQNRCSDEEV